MASGQTIFAFHADACMHVLSTDGTVSVVNNQSFKLLDAGDTVRCTVKIIKDYTNLVGIDVIVHLRTPAAGATSGNAVIGVRFERQTGLDLDGDSWGSQKTVTVTGVPGAAGTEFQATIQFSTSEIDGCVGGDMARIEVQLVTSGTTISPAQVLFAMCEGRDR